MTLADFATLLLYCSLFLFVFSAIAFYSSYIDVPPWGRKANLKDYEDEQVAFGGMLGLSRILALTALGLLSVGAILKFL